MNLLHTIGLMTRAEHERQIEILEDVLAETQAAERRLTVGRDDWRSAAKDWEAKFKRAATDLAAQAEEIAKQDGIIEGMAWEIRGHEETIAALRPDAEAMRKKRAADRKRMAGKRNG